MGSSPLRTVGTHPGHLTTTHPMSSLPQALLVNQLPQTSSTTTLSHWPTYQMLCPLFHLCVTCLPSRLLPIMCTTGLSFPSIRLSRTYPLSRYLAALSNYAMSLTPSYSVQTFSHVRFILSRSYLWLPFIVLL